MQGDSLDKLKAAFEEWRSRKRHPREAIPADLLDRARRAVSVHGSMAVWRATNVGRSRLTAGRRSPSKATPSRRRVPAYSRVEIAPPAIDRPFAEVVTPTGVKLRLFAESGEAFAWLSSLCVVEAR